MTERIQKLKAMLAQNDADSFVQHALALEYVKLGREGEAEALFQTLLARDERYVGSYYHLGKVMERTGKGEEAIAVYEKGMKVAKALNDTHAFNELRAAWEELTE